MPLSVRRSKRRPCRHVGTKVGPVGPVGPVGTNEVPVGPVGSVDALVG